MISVSGFCPPIIGTFPPPAACFSKVHTGFKGSELRFHYFLRDSEEWLRLPELNVDTTVKASKNRKALLLSPRLSSPSDLQEPISAGFLVSSAGTSHPHRKSLSPLLFHMVT